MRHRTLPAVSFATLLCLPASLLAADPASLPARGDTDVATHSGSLELPPQSGPFDPAPRTGAAVRQGVAIPLDRDSRTLSEEVGTAFLETAVPALFGISIPSGVLKVLDVVGGSPTELDLGPAGSFEPWFQVAAVGDGTVSATWPATATLTYPAPNTFACGETVEVRTTFAVGDAAAMSVDPPFHSIELGVEADDVHIDAALDFCTPGSCIPPGIPKDICPWWVGSWCLSDSVGSTGFSSPGQSFDRSVVAICEGAFDGGDLAGCGAANPVFAFQGLFLHTDPDGRIHWEPSIPKVPEIWGLFDRPDLSDLAATSSADHRVLTRSGAREDSVTLHLDLVSLLDYLCGSCPIGVNPTRVGVPGLGNADLGDVTVDYRTDQEMSYTLTPAFSHRLTLADPMTTEERTPDGTPVGAPATGTARTVTAGNTLAVTFPADRSTPVALDSEYLATATLRTLTRERYAVGSELNLVQVKFAGYEATLFHRDLLEVPTGGAETIENADTSWQVDGFPGEALALDPENPVIAVAGFDLLDARSLGGGERAVVYRLRIANEGDVPLLQTHAQLDLAEAFTAAGASDVEGVCLDGGDVAVNPSYDGVADAELLAPDNLFGLAQSSPVDVLVRVVPAVATVLPNGCFAQVEYAAHGHADATSPIGTVVHNNVYQCTGETTGEDRVATVDLGAAHVDELADFAVYGFRGLDLSRGMRLSLGNAGTGGALQVLPLRGAAVGDPRIVGDLHVAGDVHVVQSPFTVDYAQVGGRVFAGDPRAELRTTGAASERSGCVTAFAPPSTVLPPRPPEAPDVVVRRGETRVLAPGVRGRVEVAGGGRLVLRPGLHDFARLRITGDDASVRFEAGGGTLVLREWQMLPVRRLFLGAGDLATGGVFVVYPGAPKQVFRGATLAGTFLAPAAALELREGTDLLGSAAADRVLVDEGSRFVGHHELQPLPIGGDCTTALAPR